MTQTSKQWLVNEFMFFLMFLVFVVRRISQKKTLSELTCLSWFPRFSSFLKLILWVAKRRLISAIFERGKEILVRSSAVVGAVRSLSGPIPTTAPPGRQLLCSSRSSGSSSSCCCGMRCGVINYIGDNMDVNYNHIGDKLLIYNNIIIKGCGLWVQGSPIHLS